MVCNFCKDPAASPETGCQYGPSTLACFRCVKLFWSWVLQHTNQKARRDKPGKKPRVATALSFYEHAGQKP